MEMLFDVSAIEDKTEYTKNHEKREKPCTGNLVGYRKAEKRHR
jgi:hypothetical protein